MKTGLGSLGETGKLLNGGDILKRLSEKDVAAIEKAINHSGTTEAVVKVVKDEVVVLMVEKKKIS